MDDYHSLLFFWDFFASNFTNLNLAYSYYMMNSPKKSHYVYELLLHNDVYSVY